MNRNQTGVSVALITFNRIQLLKRNLPVLLAQLQPTDELLLIDNNSTDDTWKYISLQTHPLIKRLFVEKQGLNVCRNVAIREASHDWVAFIDDDAYPSKAWLTSLRSASAGCPPDSVLFAGRTLIDYESGEPEYLSHKYLYLLGGKDYGLEPKIIQKSESPGGGNMLLQRDLVLSLGGFNESFDRKGTSLLSNGETELVSRIFSTGLRIRYEPNAVIHHWAGLERLNKSWLLKRMYWQGMSDGFLAQETGQIISLCCRRLLSHLFKVPFETVRDFRNVRAWTFSWRLEISRTCGIARSLFSRLGDV